MNIAKQGKRVVYEPEARAYEHTTPSSKEEFLRKVRIVAGAVQALQKRAGLPGLHQKMFLFKYFSHKVLRWGMPVFLLSLLCTNAFLLRDHLYRLFFIAQCSFYLLALSGGTSLSLGKLSSVPFYFCMVNLAAAVGICRGLLNKQKVTWQRVRRRENTTLSK
jgi:hypothetical protein